MRALRLVEAFSPHADGGSRALSASLGVLGLIAGRSSCAARGSRCWRVLLVLGIWLVASVVVHHFREGLEDRAFQMLTAVCEIALGVLILSQSDLCLRTVADPRGRRFRLPGHAGDQRGLAAAQARRGGRSPCARRLIS